MLRKFIIISLIFLFVLAGCTPRMTIKKAPPNNSISLSGDSVLIFGRIRWTQNKEVRKSFSDFNVELRILRVEDMKTGTILEVEKDGRFFAVLPKGSYVIHSLNWGDGWGKGSLNPRVAFQVSESQHSYYLGSLVVNVKTKRNIFGDPIVKGWYLHIEDEESEAMKDFYKRYPQPEVKVAKTLMIHDPSIPIIDELVKKQILLEMLMLSVFILLSNPVLFY